MCLACFKFPIPNDIIYILFFIFFLPSYIIRIRMNKMGWVLKSQLAFLFYLCKKGEEKNTKIVGKMSGFFFEIGIVYSVRLIACWCIWFEAIRLLADKHSSCKQVSYLMNHPYEIVKYLILNSGITFIYLCFSFWIPYSTKYRKITFNGPLNICLF